MCAIYAVKDICLKHYEKEALLKNFFLFFFLMEALVVLLFWELYREAKSDFNDKLLQRMELCSYTLDCKAFGYDFVPLEYKKTHKLIASNGYRAYFPIPDSQKFMLEISYPIDRYRAAFGKQTQRLKIAFVFATILLALMAFFFTLYALRPLRNALRLNDEFVKDILHDFNTPIAAMKLNIAIFQKEGGKSERIEKVKKSIDHLVMLQENLKSFLLRLPTQTEPVDVAALLRQRSRHIAMLYPDIDFVDKLGEKEYRLQTSRELLIRIFDNLLSNAAKYNKKNGKVIVGRDGSVLTIEDTGKGIKDTEKVLRRFQKEQERGIGLGLHIVSKLCDELNIRLEIASEPGKGTIVKLDFAAVERER